MWHGSFITGCVCFTGGALALLALKFGWQETVDEATGRSIPHLEASVNCFLFGLICFFMALLTAYLPVAAVAVGTVSRISGQVNTAISQVLFVVIVLGIVAICLGGIGCYCYNLVSDARADGQGPALLAAAFLLVSLLTLTALAFPQPFQHFSPAPSFQALLRGVVRLWSGLWHPANETGGCLAAIAVNNAGLA